MPEETAAGAAVHQGLSFQVVEEGDAIYYLAEFRVRDGDKLDFAINVSPTPESAPLKVSFSQSFYSE